MEFLRVVFWPESFYIYIYDFNALHNFTVVIKYADDITLLIPYSSSKPDYVTEEINHFNTWCTTNRMTININKTQIMPILKRSAKYIYSDNFFMTTNIKILGFTFCNNLNFNQHFKNVCSRACRNIYLLKRLKNICSQKDLQTIYHTKVTSIIYYGLPLFTNITRSSLESINRINRKCHKIICEQENCSCVIEDTLNLQKEQIIRLLGVINHNNLLVKSIIPDKSKSGRFLLPKAKLSRNQKTFIFTACKIFNNFFIRT